jgi:lambda family phage portal protein
MPLTTIVTTADFDQAPPVVMPPSAPRRGPRLSGPMAAGRMGYQSSTINRTNREWLPPHLAGDMAVGAAWDLITRRARDLMRNEPWAGQIRERICQNVIGDEGFRSEADVEIDGEPDDQADEEIDAWCDRWAEECDVEGKLHLVDMQNLAMGECVEAGQAFLVASQLNDPGRVIPLAYQLLEAEQLRTDLDWPMTGPGSAGAGEVAAGNYIRRGIEFDRLHRSVAYHFWIEHPYDFRGGDSRSMRVPASRVLHLFRRNRPSQTQGITWLAAILQAMHDLSDLIANETLAGKIQSFFTVAIKRVAGVGSGLGFAGDGSDPTAGEDGDGNPLEELGPGIISDIGEKDEIEQIESKRPGPQVAPFANFLLQSMANGCGMTALGLTGDVARATFSSARFTRLLDKTFWRTLQGLFGRTVAMPMRRAAVRQLAAFGRLTSVSATQFAAQPWRWLATRLLPHGWEEIQVGDEVNAAIRRIQGGMSNLQIENAAFGRNWRKVAKQRARELAYTRDVLGLDLAVDYPGQASASAQESPEEQPQRSADDEAGMGDEQ